MAGSKATAFRVERTFTREQPKDKGGNWATARVKKSYFHGRTYPIEALSERDRKWAEAKKFITVLKHKPVEYPDEAAQKAVEEEAAKKLADEQEAAKKAAEEAEAKKAEEEAELAKMMAEEEAAKQAE